jgi:predicted RNase H-like HicB family nuclease
MRSGMPNELHFTIRAEDGAFWATVEEFPGVFATGTDLEDLRESLEAGISLYLAEPGEDPACVRLDVLRPDPVAASAHVAYA